MGSGPRRRGRKSSTGIYDVRSCVDVVPGAIQGKVDRLDAFPLGAPIWKVNTEAYDPIHHVQCGAKM